MVLSGLKKIIISITDMCNRKCNICPHMDESLFPNSKVWMTLDTAKNIANQLQQVNYTGTISLSGFGEPLLHPKVLQIIWEFTKRNIKIRLVTNGDLLVKNKINTELLDKLGLFEITISIYDGKEVFEKYSKIIKSQFKKTYVRFRDMSFSSHLEGSAIHFSINNRGGMLGDFGRKEKICYRPFYETQIDWNGDFLICCNSWSKKIKYGNLNIDRIDEIWNNNELLNNHRQLLKQGKRECVETCNGCDYVEKIPKNKYWVNFNGTTSKKQR